jgi:hypothetical protein
MFRINKKKQRFLFLFWKKGISLVSNNLLQNAIVELGVIDLVIRIMESTQHIDIKVRQ